ncbi:NAD(P)-dependent oxidoreductase [Aquirufa sp. ROCK2-A2]
MKIAILDGFTLFQHDIDWNSLSDSDEILYFDRTDAKHIPLNILNADVLITNKFLLNESNLNLFNQVKLIVVSATGYNCVDVQACKSRGIQVSNVPNYGTFSVAQHALAMLLNWSNFVDIHQESVKNGDWVKSKDWCYTVKPLIEWQGKNLGIIGMGNIGKCFAQMAASLGMNVYYHHTKDLGIPNYQYVSKEELAKISDVISLHCPLNPTTDKLINKDFLAFMKPNSILINTSRGGLIQSEDLAVAVQNKQIAGALLDVLEVEPPIANHPLIGIEGIHITPHIAWISFEARSRILKTMQDVLYGFKTGKKICEV